MADTPGAVVLQAGHLYNICYGLNQTDCISFAQDEALGIGQTNSNVPFFITPASNTTLNPAPICNTRNNRTSCLAINTAVDSDGSQDVYLRPASQSGGAPQLWTLQLASSDASDPSDNWWSIQTHDTGKRLYWDTNASLGLAVESSSSDTWQLVDLAARGNSTATTTATTGVSTSASTSTAQSASSDLPSSGDRKSGGLSTGAIVGIIIGVLLALSLLASVTAKCCLLRRRRRRGRSDLSVETPAYAPSEEPAQYISPTSELQSTPVFEKAERCDTRTKNAPTELPVGMDETSAQTSSPDSVLVSPYSAGNYDRSRLAELPSP